MQKPQFRSGDDAGYCGKKSVQRLRRKGKCHVNGGSEAMIQPKRIEPELLPPHRRRSAQHINLPVMTLKLLGTCRHRTLRPASEFTFERTIASVQILQGSSSTLTWELGARSKRRSPRLLTLRPAWACLPRLPQLPKLCRTGQRRCLLHWLR